MNVKRAIAVMRMGLIQYPLVTFLAMAIFSGAHAGAEIVTFEAWKASRVDEAKILVEKAAQELKAPRASLTTRSTEASLRPSKPPDQRLQSAQDNLAVAQDLTVNDYFVLYLRQFKSREELVEAAKKLSPHETAELLLAYQKALNGAQ